MPIEDRRYPLNTPEEDRAAGAQEVCWRCSKTSEEMEFAIVGSTSIGQVKYRRMCPRCVCGMEDHRG